MAKIYLGIIDSEKVYLTKHTWSCNWYWSFGWLGNRNLHFHFESLLGSETNVNKIFTSTWLDQEAWWILRDLFVQAYGLQKAAEIYQHGGNQAKDAFCFKDSEMAARLNADLELILGKIWKFLQTQWAITHLVN